MPPKNRKPVNALEKEMSRTDASLSNSSINTPQRTTSRGATPTAVSTSTSRRTSVQPHGTGALVTTTPHRAPPSGDLTDVSQHPPGSFPYRAEQAFNKFAISEAASHKVLPIVSVQNALFALELNPSAARVTSALAHDGYSHRGLLLSDFQRLCKQFLATYASLDAMIKNFKALDADGDDKISRAQFSQFISDLPPSDRIAGRSLDEVMESLDPDRTGMISLRSFLKSLFPDFTDEEICAAMIENGCDPEREEREREERAAIAAEEARRAREEAKRAFEEAYETILSEERMLRTEIQAEQKEVCAESLERPFEVLEELLAKALVEKQKREAQLAEEEERVARERAAAESAEQAEKERVQRAEKERAEAERLEKEAKEAEERNKLEKAKAQAEEETRRQKEKAAAEEAERKRKRDEEEKAKKAAETPAPPKPKDSGGCCLVM